MSKAKHTKGKWVVSPCPGYDELHYICAIPNNVVVARTCYATQGEANARLIAEAPAMYEMLQEIADKFDNDQHLLNVSPTKIKELIKKIEG